MSSLYSSARARSAAFMPPMAAAQRSDTTTCCSLVFTSSTRASVKCAEANLVSPGLISCKLYTRRSSAASLAVAVAGITGACSHQAARVEWWLVMNATSSLVLAWMSLKWSRAKMSSRARSHAWATHGIQVMWG